MPAAIEGGPPAKSKVTITKGGVLVNDGPEQVEKKVYGDKEQISALIESFCAVQAELKTIGKSGYNKFLDYKYSNLDDALDALRPLTAKHGLALMQFPEDPHTVVTYVYHKSGAFIASRTCCDTSGALPEIDRNGKQKPKNPHQDFGRGITYLKRYAVCAIFAISSGDIDDDAQGARQMVPQENQANFNAYLKKIKNPSRLISNDEKKDIIQAEESLTDNQKKRLCKIVDEQNIRAV